MLREHVIAGIVDRFFRDIDTCGAEPMHPCLVDRVFVFGLGLVTASWTPCHEIGLFLLLGELLVGQRSQILPLLDHPLLHVQGGLA